MKCNEPIYPDIIGVPLNPRHPPLGQPSSSSHSTKLCCLGAGVARQPGMLRCAERCVGGGVPRGMARQAWQATGELGKHLAEPMGTWSRHVPAWSGERWVRNLHITIKRISATNVKILIYEMGLHFWFSVICSTTSYVDDRVPAFRPWPYFEVGKYDVIIDFYEPPNCDSTV